jgi:DNA invertase Pin-like site-specific DNA recombinase
MTDRAVGIVRVSQRDDDTGQSPQVQTHALGQMADLHGWRQNPADILDENVDNGRVRNKSGGASLEDRPKLRWAVEEIEAGRARILAAENFDRLFRNLELQRQVVSRVEDAGGEVWERSGRISHKRASDKFVATIKGASSEYVKDTAEERSWDAVDLAIAQGRVPWSQTAPGYARDSESRLHPDTERVSIVERAFRMRLDGATIEEVRAHLARNGIRRSYHGTMHLLRDRIYVGEIHFGTHTPNLQAHKPIIDRGVFDGVQDMKVPRGRKSKSDRLLARLGVLRCGSCDARMVVGTSNNSSYYIYRCPPTGDCTRRVTISARLVEEVVVDEVQRLIADIRERVSTESVVEDAEGGYAEAQQKLDAATRIALQSGVLDEPAAIERLTTLREERDAAKDRYDRALSDEVTESIVLSAEDWDVLTLEERRELVRAVIERVTVSPVGRGAERLTINPRQAESK